MKRSLPAHALAIAGLVGCGSGSEAPTVVSTTPAPPDLVPVDLPGSRARSPRCLTCITRPQALPELNQYVDNAIASVVKNHPEMFDLHDDLFDGNFKVLDRSKYVKAVVEAIHAQGVCAVEEFEEIAIKNTNAFNEQYNVWVSTGGYIRKGPGAYITTCFPAQF